MAETPNPPAPDPRDHNGAISASNFLHSFWSLGFVSLCGLVTNVVLARWLLGVGEMGHIRVVRSVMDFACIPAGLGMAVTSAKFAADSRLDAPARGAVLETALRLALAASCAVTLVLFSLSLWPGMLRDQTARHIIRVVVWVIPIVVIYRTSAGHMQGLGEIRWVAFQQAGRSALILVVLLGCVRAMGLAGWLVAIPLSEAVSLALVAPVIARLSRTAPVGADPRPASFRPAMLRFGSHMAATQTLQAMFISVDVLCLDRFHNDPEMIAQYGMATLIFGTTLLLPQSFIQSHFFQMASRGHDAPSLWRRFTHFFTRVMGVIVLAGIAGYFCSPFAGWIFGHGYENTGVYLGWLMPSFVFQSAALLVGSFVISAGLSERHLGSVAAAAALNLVLCLTLIPRWGAAGAAVTLTLTFAFRAAVSLLILWRHRRN